MVTLTAQFFFPIKFCSTTFHKIHGIFVPYVIQRSNSCECWLSSPLQHPTRSRVFTVQNCAPNFDGCISHWEFHSLQFLSLFYDRYQPLHAKLFMIPISLAAPVLFESATLSDPVLVKRSTTFSMSCALSCFDSLDSSKKARGTLSFSSSGYSYLR